MYNDPFPPLDELNDPAFWAAVTAQVDALSLTQGEGYSPPILPTRADIFPFRGTVSGLAVSGASRLPIPALPPPAQQDTTEVIHHSPSRNDQQSSLLVGVLVMLAGVLFFAVVFGSQATTQTVRQLKRLNQWDAGQYKEGQSVATWGPSACSAAAIAEDINYWGHDYLIGDVLAVEIATGQITPELGLLNGYDSVAITVSRFGFEATPLKNPSVDTVIEHANNGEPVLVSFPPSADWPGGHILNVRGGNSQNVALVDSSRLNMQELPRKTFLRYWGGFAIIIKPK